MTQVLRYLVVVPFALLLAITAGVIMFFIASTIVPELGLLIGSGLQAFTASIFNDAMDGFDPSLKLEGALSLGGRLALAIFIAPALLVAVVSELFRLRSGSLQTALAGILAALLPLAMLQLSRSPTAAEGRIIGALFAVGAVSGLVYWLVAGRRAGGAVAPAINGPVSPGS